jgi:hypothetical protein
MYVQWRILGRIKGLSLRKEQRAMSVVSEMRTLDSVMA